MNDGEVIKAFQTYLGDIKHLSPHTVHCYGTDLQEFADYLASREEAAAEEVAPEGEQASRLLRATTADVTGFLEARVEQGCAQSTISRKRATLSSFYGKFCKHSGLRSENPAASVKPPKPAWAAPLVLSSKEISQLMSAPDCTTVLGARDRAILELIYSTAVRVGELVGMKGGNIDLDAGVFLLARHGSVHEISIGQVALGALRHYLRLRGVERLALDAPLFLNKHGRRLSCRSVRRKVDKYLALAGLDPGVSPRVLRHSHARHRLDQGAGLEDLQADMGHRSLSTTHMMYGESNAPDDSPEDEGGGSLVTWEQLGERLSGPS